MRKDDVAIIGAAGVFPGADDAEALHARLRAGRESVGEPGEARVRSGADDPGARYLTMGYLDRIDLFDHELFGMSLREAEQLDPHQRLLLHLTHQAIESAGYAPAGLRGTSAAVLLAAVDPGAFLEGERDVEAMLGTSPAALAARISYLFDLRGPALVLDTACSSGLSALGVAVGKLRAGEVPLAVVGGVNVFPRLIRRSDWLPLQGLESVDGHCRPFDADAQGLVAGEGGGVVLMKLLSDAVADGDNVLAVVKGVAVNHNGFRAASMAAPSPLGQASAMTEAWRDGEVPADTIGYIECHGSGTPLGDVVEVEALRKAFADSGVTERSCAIGSVKGNIGHLGNAAGFAGLFKVMSAFRHGVHYPAANFASPNPLIDFSGPVYVNTASRPWPRSDGHPRRAGLSSWGLTGTNAHAVLEQAPPAVRRPDEEPAAELVTVSARSPAALARYRDRLAGFAERTDQPLRAVAHVLNRGRDDHPYRLAVTAASTGELAAHLRAAAVPDRPAGDAPRAVLLLSGDALLDDAAWSRLCAGLPLPARCAELDAAAQQPAARLVVRQYALCRVAEALGLTDLTLIGSGAGNLAVRAARGRLPLADAVAEAVREERSPAPDRERLRQVVAGFVRDGAVLVEPAAGGVLAREIRSLAPESPVVDLAADGSRAGVLERLGRLYALGVQVDWDRHYGDAAPPRIEAPTYPFEPTPCRLPAAVAPARSGDAPAPTGGPAALPALAETERRLAAIWAELLEQPDVGPDSDYFRLGGTSLLGVGLLRRLQQSFGVAATFADLYAHPTVRELAARLHAAAGERVTAPGGAAAGPITPVERGGPLPLSPGQEALWHLEQVNPAGPLYNVPTPMHLTGPLDADALQDALIGMTERHETLRSLFLTGDDGTPYVSPTAPEPLMSVVNLSRMPPEQRVRRVRTLVHDEVSAPFDLTRHSPLRAVLVKLAEEEHVFLLTFHHIVFDGGSQAVFGRDLAELYRARSTGTEAELPHLPVQYQDYAAWHRALLDGPHLERGLEYWRQHLSGLDRPELPLDRPRPETRSYAGDQLTFAVDAGVAERIREYSRDHGVTTFVTMLAALDTLLHLWSGQTDLVVGVATSGRVHADLQNLVGYFNNLLPFRTGITPRMSFDEVVRRCADTVAGALDHEDVPLSKVITAADAPRHLGRHPLYDVTYTYQNVPQYEDGMGGVTRARYTGTDVGGTAPGTSKFDLTFAIVDAGNGPMSGELEYATSLFDRATARRLADWFPALVAAVAAGPERAVGDLARPVGIPAPARPAGPPARRTAPPAPADGEPSPPGAQEVLVRLFRELIGVDGVGADDDFFTLGGDSVMSIRMAARAREEGVRITQRQVFELRTPAALAAAAAGRPAERPVRRPATAPDTGASAGFGTETGPGPRTTTGPAPQPPTGADREAAASDTIPLTPAMREVAERTGLPGRFTQSAVVAVPAGLDHATLTAAVRALVGLHGILRAELLRPDPGDPATWSLWVPGAEPADGRGGAGAEVRRVDAAGLGERELTEAARRESRTASGQLDPGAGVMARFVWLDRGAAEDGRLVVAAHHLVVDILSWQVLLPDLRTAYEALAGGNAAELPPVPVPFARWARELAARAGDPSWQTELPVWERVLAPVAAPLGGRPLDPERDTVAEGRRASVRVPPSVTAELLTAAPAVYYTGTADLVLAALAAAVAEWSATGGGDARAVVVDIESHGREPLTDDMDLSRTVGWFTSVYPVRLEPGPLDFTEVRSGGPAAGRLVKRIKEQLGAVPGNGLGYGLLRHVTPGADGPLAALPGASIGFNYVGRLGQGPAPSPAQPVPGHWRQVDGGGDLAESTPFGHALEADAVAQGTPDGAALELSLRGSRHLIGEHAMRELCESWAALLTGLAAHARRPDAGGHVPSDFPLVSLSQAQIDQLERELRE
ncbi:condensation domain-containing protein [Streptomyces sp. NPDC000134]|uniref:condensation domain-containing protein n=1 Tax=Streptomyces sp. NPDC000134 TaxID=3364536 RepID=UPI00367DC643